MVRDLRNQTTMRVWNADAAFRKYPWSVGEANPDPAEYRNVCKDLWIRRYMVFGVLLGNGAENVTNLSVLQPRRMGNTEFYAIPVRVTCQTPAQNVADILRYLLTTPEGDQTKLFVIPREISIKKGKGDGKPPAPVVLEFLVDVVDFEPEPAKVEKKK